MEKKFFMKPFSIKKFVSRAPRYRVQSEDEQSVRFLRKSKVQSEKGNQEEAIHSSELLNISATGLAFKTEEEVELEVGEKIKVEFPIPGFRQAAWWARVVRIQKQKKRDWFGNVIDNQKEDIVVGLHFCSMPVQHHDLISREINSRFKKIEKLKKKKIFKKWLEVIKEYGIKVLLLVLVALLTFFLLYLLSRPSMNYHPSFGSPWGKRFKAF